MTTNRGVMWVVFVHDVLASRRFRFTREEGAARLSAWTLHRSTLDGLIRSQRFV